MQTQSLQGRLNEQQLDMIRLLERPMPEEDFLQMKRLAVQLLAKRLDDAVEKWETENGITADYYEDLSRQHLRSSSKNAK